MALVWVDCSAIRVCPFSESEFCLNGVLFRGKRWKKVTTDWKDL